MQKERWLEGGVGEGEAGGRLWDIWTIWNVAESALN